MLDKIKKVLFESYGSEEQKWIFLSWFSEEHWLIVSQGALTTDLSLHELLDVLYKEIEENIKDIVFISIDIVSEIIQIERLDDALDKDPKEFWFALIWAENKSWVILPGIEWIADAKHALHHVKKKYDIQWNVEVFIFRTERIVVSK